MSNVERVKQLKQELQRIQKEHDAALEELKRDSMSLLAEKTREIQDLYDECTKLANSMDMRFFFTPGYEEFRYVSEDDWNSSSMHC